VESLDDPKPHAVSKEGIGSGFVMSSDGKFVATRGPDQKIYIFPVDGGEPKLVPGVQPGEIATGWSPDGRTLFVMGRGQVPAQVVRIDLSSGQRTPWKTVEPADAAGIDTVGRLLMSSDNKSYVYAYVRTLSDLYLVQGLK
jgi:Tol biopolymer transport system component